MCVRAHFDPKNKSPVREREVTPLCYKQFSIENVVF